MICGMIDVTRKDEQTVRNRLGNSAAVVLLGPRQVGKTTLAKALARSLGLTFGRVQFTADLLPADARHQADGRLRGRGRGLHFLDGGQVAGQMEIWVEAHDRRHSGPLVLCGPSNAPMNARTRSEVGSSRSTRRWPRRR